ncbi:hypothetical protein GYMLUDRAFT_34453, partial [Collybiopsis luxurians FD-317 M1]
MAKCRLLSQRYRSSMDPSPILRNISADLGRLEYIDAARQIHSIKVFAITSFVMLVYDLLLTFADEVEIIWCSERRNWTMLTALWVINRYLWPLAFVVVTVSFHDPDWSESACERYVLYPQCVRLVHVAVVGIYFIMRLYAIYERNRWVLGLCIASLSVLIAVKTWAFTDGTRLVLPPGLVGCFLVPKHPSQDRFLYTYVSEVVFDAGVFIATIMRILKFSVIGTASTMVDILYRGSKNSSSPILILFGQQGCVYFAMITLVNLLNVFLYRFAPIYEMNMLTSLSCLLSSLITSHLMLHLQRKCSAQSTDSLTAHSDLHILSIIFENRTDV